MNHSFLVDKKYKIIWIGDSGVGKTCLLTKAQKNFFDQELKSTLGFEYYNITIKIKNKKILLQTWDTCGQESFKCIVNMFYKRVKLAILVYSIDNRKSFEGINFWLNEIRLNSDENVKLILVGNKNDLNDKREVSYEEGEAYAKSHKMMFLETSAKTGHNINQIFEKSVKQIAKNISNNVYDLDNDSCGIRVGLNKETFILGEGNKEEDDNKDKKRCC